jgi:hypothetical protein
LTYSIFASSGNLMDAFDARDDAAVALGRIVKADPEAADAVFLVAQDDAGQSVGEAV